MFKFQLAQTVRDELSGFEGYIDNIVEHLYGCTRYCVTPPMRDGLIQDSIMFDEPQLSLVAEATFNPYPHPEKLIELGAYVVDPIRAITGVAMARAIYINGCSRIMIQLQGVHHQEFLAVWAEEESLYHSKNVVGDIKYAVNKEKKPIKKSGGPMSGPSSKR